MAPRPSTMTSAVGISYPRQRDNAITRLRDSATASLPKSSRSVKINFLNWSRAVVESAEGVGYHRVHMATSRPAARQPVRRPTSGKLRAIIQDVGTPPPAPFVPAPFQEAALAAVRAGDVLVAAPTGSGKTWIAEQAISEILTAGGVAWYTTPLKALSNQKFHRFSGLYGAESVGLLTGERRINAQAPVIVATTEILRNALYGDRLTPQLIVLDEAHYLSDRERGTAWEEILLLAPRRSRLLLLSATFPNAEVIASWLAEVRGKRPEVIVEAVRPVPLRYVLADGRGRLIPPDALGHLPSDGRPSVRNSPEGPVVLRATEFQQMSGRAGRRGKDTIGVVVLPAASRDEAREGLALIDAEPDPVTSSFSPGYVQVLNLLRRVSLGEALRELNRSLAAYEKRGEVQRVKNAIGSIPPDDLAERPCDDRLITRGRYERMAERLRKLQKQRGTQADIAALSAELTAWPCATCPVEQRCLATLEALRARELRRSSLRQALHSLEGALADEFTRRAAVLRRLGYLDENSRLTPEGLWASELRHPRMLVLAEIVRRSLIGGSTAAWAAVAGALATERAPYRGGEAGLGAVIQLARELDVLERQHALPPDGLVQQCEPEWDPQSRRRLPPPAERRADVVMAWMRAADWSALVAESHAEEGDLQRIILQAAEVLMQIEGLPFPDVRTAARDARLRLLRSPVV